MIVLSFLSLLFILFLINGIGVNTMFFSDENKSMESFNLISVLEFQRDVDDKMNEVEIKFEQIKKIVYQPKYHSSSKTLSKNKKLESVEPDGEKKYDDNVVFDDESMNNVSLEMESDLDIDLEEIYEGEYEEIVFEDEFIFE